MHRRRKEVANIVPKGGAAAVCDHPLSPLPCVPSYSIATTFPKAPPK